jgi:hypothetical protein
MLAAMESPRSFNLAVRSVPGFKPVEASRRFEDVASFAATCRGERVENY